MSLVQAAEDAAQQLTCLQNEQYNSQQIQQEMARELALQKDALAQVKSCNLTAPPLNAPLGVAWLDGGLQYFLAGGRF